MCLGVPGKVIAIDGLRAQVDFFGVTKELRLDVVDEPVQVGDYVLNHVGYAIRRIPPDEVEETLAFFEQVLASGGPGGAEALPAPPAGSTDLMALDVRGEMKAGKEKA